MQVYVTDAEVTRLEQALNLAQSLAQNPAQSMAPVPGQTGQGAQRLPLLVELAWHLRQRDTQRSLALAQLAQGLLPLADSALARRRFELRLMLIQAEGQWLTADFAPAKALAQQALAGFTELDDRAGIADVNQVLAGLAVDQGNTAARDAALQAMYQAAHGVDPVRAVLAQTALARSAIFRDIGCYQERLQACRQNAPAHPVADCALADFQGVASALSSDFAAAIRHLHQSYTLALASGQIRRAILAAGNLGDALSSLNEYQAALEWMQRGLDLARKSGWPSSIGSALIQTAQPMHQLHRHEGARLLLLEAIGILAPLAASRSYAVALQYLGDVELDCHEYASALATFQLLEQRAQDLNHPDLQALAQRGQAHALLQLDKPQAALDVARSSLQLAQARPDLQIASLRVMADILARQDDAAALNCLQQALELAAGIEGYTVGGEVYDGVAREYAKLGDFAKAYEFSLQASLAREKTHNREATNRAIALQAQHQTERALAESEHHRQLAASEARRAQVLQKTSDTLAYLGTIGQEITAHLDRDAVFDALTRHIHHLLDVSACTIYLMTAEGDELEMAFGFEDGKALPPNRIALFSPISDTARCVRERREILIDQDPQLDDPSILPGTRPTLSALFAPLVLAENVLGAISIQSFQRHAYGQREQMIFRTLCAYTAIALSNAMAHGELASAHRHLQETQQQMVLQGKMAGLGTLTAGVAHEINNPTNFAHVAAQNLRVDLHAFQQFLTQLVDADSEPEIMAAFASHFAGLNTHLATIMEGTGRIKGIVRDLRAFTRLDEAEKKSVRISECLVSTLNLVRTSWQDQVEFITDWQADPEIECWPALLNQVFMNLLVNGCQAIAEKAGRDGPAGWDAPVLPVTGVLRIGLRQEDGWVHISFADNGIGIRPDVQSHILEPFYTTKSVGLGTGLGLSIAYGIIHKHDGQLAFESTPGEGSCFVISLPLPRPSAAPMA